VHGCSRFQRRYKLSRVAQTLFRKAAPYMWLAASALFALAASTRPATRAESVALSTVFLMFGAVGLRDTR